MPSSSSRPRSVAVAAAAALLLPAAVSAPARAELVDGLQDVRDLACAPGVVPSGSFSDMDGQLPEYVLGADCLLETGVTRGTSVSDDGTRRYSPAAPVPRRQMAQFVARTAEAAGLELDDSPSDANAFHDLQGLTGDAVSAIRALASLGVVLGRGDGTYAPDAPVRRDQMAAFLNRLQDALAEADEDVEPFPPAPPGTFPDTSSPDVLALAGAGVVQGRSDGTYDPAGSITRAQMAAFLTRYRNAYLAAVGVESLARVDNRVLEVSRTDDAPPPGTPDPDGEAEYAASGLSPDTAYRVTLAAADAWAEATSEGDEGTSLVSFDATVVAGADDPGPAVRVADLGSVGAVDDDPTQPGASVVRAGGVALASPSAAVTVTSDADGALTFAVASGGAAVTVTPFLHPAPPTARYPSYDDGLEVTAQDVDPGPGEIRGVPVEPFGVGPAASFAAPTPRDATAQDDGVSGRVVAVDTDDLAATGGTFTLRLPGQVVTYAYDADDVFGPTPPGGTARTLQEFAATLGEGDTVRVLAYEPEVPGSDPEVSSFDVTDDRTTTRTAAPGEFLPLGVVTGVDRAADTVTVRADGQDVVFSYEADDEFSADGFVGPLGDDGFLGLFEATVRERDLLRVGSYAPGDDDFSSFRLRTVGTARAATADDAGRTGLVTRPDAAAGTFVLVDGRDQVTYAYDASDVFLAPGGAPYEGVTAFEAALASGDVVTVTVREYDASGTSTFAVDATATPTPFDPDGEGVDGRVVALDTGADTLVVRDGDDVVLLDYGAVSPGRLQADDQTEYDGVADFERALDIGDTIALTDFAIFL